MARQEMYVLVTRAMPEAPWEVFAFGCGDGSRENLLQVAESMNQESGSDEWQVLSQSELAEESEAAHARN